MARLTDTIPVYLEIGKKRAFAGAIDWPGWCRSGRDETSALTALFDYGPRYAHTLRATQLGFETPVDAFALSVSVRLKGNTTTDFGSPAIAPPSDNEPVNDTELHRFTAILKACWREFEEAVKVAKGRELRKGPRGGGRDLQKILEHVLDANGAYLGRLGWKFEPDEVEDPSQELDKALQLVLKALHSTAALDKPTIGPRGGVRWMSRYFVRRVAWHMLDHAWEIEDRIV